MLATGKYTFSSIIVVPLRVFAPNVLPGIPGILKPKRVGIGKGKGSVEFWSCQVMPGTVLFEIGGIPREKAIYALSCGASKLPVRVYISG